MAEQSNIIAISNTLNSVQTTRWPKEYDNIFWSLLSCFYVKGEIVTEISIDKKQLIALSHYSLRSNKKFAKTLDDFWDLIKFLDVKDSGRTEAGMNFYHAVSIFRKFHAEWSDDFSEMTLEVKLDEDAKGLLMKKNKWMKLELEEYLSLNSMYARALYRLCSQWANLGKVRISLEELMLWMQLPESCREQHNMRKRVFKPFLEQCSPYFEDLKVTPVKMKDKTSKVFAYEITFKPRFVGAFIEGRFNEEVSDEQISRSKLRQQELSDNFDALTPKEKRELSELNDWLHQHSKAFVAPKTDKEIQASKERLNHLVARFADLNALEKEEFYVLSEWDEQSNHQLFDFQSDPFGGGEL